MKKQLLLLLIFSISLYVQGQNIHKLASPDGNIQISVNLSDKIYYDVICRNETLLKQCHLAMEIGDQELGTNPKMTKVSHKNIDESLKPVIPLKFSSVSNRYNQLLLDFKGGYSVEFRAFNDGIAYRFISKVIRITPPAEPYLGSHQAELLQIIVDCPPAYPQQGGQFVQASGPFHPDQPVHPVDPLYIADN